MSIGRLLAIGSALLMAIACGAVALAVGVAMDPALRDILGQLGLSGLEAVLSDLAEGYAPDPGMVEGALSLGRAVLLLVAVPPVLNAVVGEVLGWRALAWYGGATGLLTALLPWLMRGAGGPAGAGEGRVTAILFCAGGIAGLVYWLAAGRFAGRGPATMWAAPRR
ncbi:hypothetical protein [Methylobacterium platani]|uniref:Uncharacterized protein n=2 Tax=Methylobacterium platani TaxID=427683 RepID=A0A179SGM4_9HYPH|nr:hypothetical protein [Methylobacterium platani]KMO11628.1 hypothetical protein SQ03_26555 [Methylobacterium platani JCM 14648]OAS27017.1 hypothetical protein A5481_03375 [Methylobacterium platani]